MKCMKCGHAMRSRREDVPDGDLPSVILDSVTVNRCPACGAWEVEIPHHADLTKELAKIVISKPSRLSKEEIRYLRSSLYDSAAGFAQVIGHDASTVSRWENGHQKIGRHAELLLRLMVAHEKRIPGYAIAKLKDVAIETTRDPASVRVRFDGERWVAVDAQPARKPTVRARRGTATASPRRPVGEANKGDLRQAPTVATPADRERRRERLIGCDAWVGATRGAIPGHSHAEAAGSASLTPSPIQKSPERQRGLEVLGCEREEAGERRVEPTERAARAGHGRLPVTGQVAFFRGKSEGSSGCCVLRGSRATGEAWASVIYAWIIVQGPLHSYDWLVLSR